MGWGENRIGSQLNSWDKVDKLEAKVAEIQERSDYFELANDEAQECLADAKAEVDRLKAELAHERWLADQKVFALSAEIFRLRNKVVHWVDRAMTAEDDPNPYWSTPWAN